MSLELENIEVGEELKEKEKWLSKREQYYRENGFYNRKYEWYKDAKHIILEKTNTGVLLFCGKKTDKGINTEVGFDMKDLNIRFEKK